LVHERLENAWGWYSARWPSARVRGRGRGDAERNQGYPAHLMLAGQAGLARP